MKKNDLLKKDGDIIRVLGTDAERVLVIDCIRKVMPVWWNITDLNEYTPITEEDFLTIVEFSLSDESLTPKQKEIMHRRFGMISPILPFVAKDRLRGELLRETAEQNGVSVQTVRGYLCAYLVYQSMAILAPKPSKERELSENQKNIRWALNKYYYTPYRNTLTDAYTMMLRAKYTDKNGVLFTEYPSIHQFRYYYKTHRKLQTQYISREGKSAYYRNHRPLLGEGVVKYCPTVGYGMLDSTIMDIYLRDEQGKVVGRPILTLSVDGYSSMILGYCLSWEGGVVSLHTLLQSQIEDKVEHCRKHGITISSKEWNCQSLCSTYITDRGTEYLSYQIEQLTELGITIKNLEAFHPNDKSRVEICFGLVQNAYKPYLNGCGVVQKENYMEITGRDYRKESSLTLESFRRIVLECIIYYNTRRVIENFPYTDQMLSDGIKPYANIIFNWGLLQDGTHLISVSSRELWLVMLPRTKGKFTREGLIVNKIRYRAEGYTERYLSGGTFSVAYCSTDISKVWLIEEGRYIEFELIEARLRGKKLSEARELRQKQKEMLRQALPEQIQAKVDLAEKIRTAVDAAQMIKKETKNG